MLPKYEIRKSDLTVKQNNYELNFPEHMHKYIEIVYVFDGVQPITIEDKKYIIKKGDAIVIFPDTIHSYNAANKEIANVLIIICDPKLFGNLFPDIKNLRPKDPIIPKNLINNEMKSALKSISPNSRFEIQFSWTCVIMAYLLEILDLQEQESVPVSDLTQKIIIYIEENFTEDITRESLAQTFNVNKYYISRIFSDKIRMSLRNYLGLKRAEYAASFIRTTNQNLTSICEISGFESQRTFNRMFKAAYGMTPREYRNNISQFIKND